MIGLGKVAANQHRSGRCESTKVIYFGYPVQLQDLRLKPMKSQIGQWGNSLAVRIPRYVVEALALKPNDTVECSVEDGKLVFAPIQTLPELSLDELLAGIVEAPEGEVDWGKPVGNEIW
jgi:antitoxin MazE